MLEIGRDQPYLEHWERDESDLVRCGALKLSAKGVDGFLVIAGEDFAYARGRAAPLPPGGTLLACLAGAGGHTEALALVDCEISIGRFDGGKLRVDRSSLPFREGRTLDPELDLAAGVLRTDDVTREGRPIKRVWRIAETEGDVADLAGPF
ncbi:hypothetical protein [Hansschlegelia plantiphila]|uniref:Uncharacterized protein n=1 Tax=Hansschlegelia plantiphila TaxID=374655 RepID=A0A9W6MUA7_9HYPH|nr:hypothetical protein [Hansschlegelia plantiphila]GLK67194.1 hypothetical protein GCM10008179_08320 [Hansschlegelia plantiphila]